MTGQTLASVAILQFEVLRVIEAVEDSHIDPFHKLPAAHTDVPVTVSRSAPAARLS
jgi:hypothetical protein